ncbi:MAG: CmpX protein [Candidatus Yanofskybacteria bacterium GW2011_GWA1_39_13]|uniref:CmpX protein n=1 Tax=Yanofskybacteria sp. (strain GW2011_GWA1_39_13) TaxID=1619019 RepID=A0A0G0ME93_YANXG|nr:MAG: CmpX protein [Candidatus Yanofskybacteria bacterium GW2011_GWA1_39_13]
MFEVVAASDIVRNSLLTLWGGVALFLPRFIAAIVVFLVGWLIAELLGKLAYHVVKILHVDNALAKVGFRQAWEKSGFRLDIPVLFYELVKWFFVAVFLMAATNILGLGQVSEFLKTVVFYLPNVIVAMVILLIGILVAKFLEGLVRASVKAAGLMSANFLGALTKWAVFTFSLLIALAQLKVADDIIKIVITGLIAAGALAMGLAFGLGGVKHAEQMIGDLRKRIEE